MDDNEQLPEPQSPSELAIVMAFIVCLVSSAIFYPIAKQMVEPLEIGWVKFLIYAIVPISVTFIFLYRSRWYPEIMGVTRTCYLLLITCAILVVVVFTFEFVIYIAPIIFGAVSNGDH